MRDLEVKLSFSTQSVGIEKGLFGSKTPSWHSVVVNFILIVAIPRLEPLGSQRCPKDQLKTIQYHVGDMCLRAAGAEDMSPSLRPQDIWLGVQAGLEPLQVSTWGDGVKSRLVQPGTS